MHALGRVECPDTQDVRRRWCADAT
jgi:hypothetical protein